MLSRWLAADARAEWAGAKPSRTVIQDGADGGIYSHSSTVFGLRREGYKISLVTGVVLCCLSSGAAAGTSLEPRSAMLRVSLMPLSQQRHSNRLDHFFNHLKDSAVAVILHCYGVVGHPPGPSRWR
jgi:hypothetical protein